MTDVSVGIGVVGCGGFAHFAVPNFRKVRGVDVVAVADVVPEAAQEAGERFRVPYYTDLEEMCARDDVNLVYIATPPFLHHPQSITALTAGKHVICEKPLAMNVDQADEMIALAHDKDLLLVANLMQRYNPLFDSVRQLIESEALGKPLHGYFENYASDEQLSPSHWFWDPEKSGGIFVEHAVHFFELFEGWLGAGTVESAQCGRRPESGIEDQVQCAVRYENDCLVNFYHGFTQVGRMDRQEMRLLFERGDVTLHEWIPTIARVRGLGEKDTLGLLTSFFPDSRVEIVETYSDSDRMCTGRHRSLTVENQFELVYGEWIDKMAHYAFLLREMLEDQTKWIQDRSHVRRITERSGRASLALAQRATELAHG